MAGWGQINNGQSPMAQTYWSFHILTFTIRPTVSNGIGHTFQEHRRCWCTIEMHYACNSTHGSYRSCLNADTTYS